LAVSASILSDQVNPINLEAAFNLGGVQNPQIRLAGQQISQAVAERQFAIAQVFPTINVGTNFDSHTGTLQQSSGNILKVNRNALYAGAGANAVAAGTVNIPGILWDGNLSVSLFNYLKARQLVAERQANLFATSNHMLLEVAARYFELMRAEQARAIAIQIRGEAREVARITASYAATGQGREADANRAATEFRRRDVQVLEFEGDVLRASAQLAQLLNLDPSVRLHPTDPWAVPLGIVPEDLTLPQLLSIGLTQRPEMAERQAAVRFAFLNLRNFKVLPFSPNTRIGFSAGTFGGGSNLSQPPYNVSPYFGNFSARSDFDVIAYWTLKNCAVGNVALINKAAAEYNITDLELLKTLNTVRAQVASAQAKALARFAQIAINERAVQTGQAGFSEDLVRTKAAEGLPIEVLNNLDLLARARFELLAAIIEYNVAEFELYVALGQPPATALAMSGNPLPGAEEIPTPNAAAPQGPVLPQPLPAPEKETQP
jgi:outer membrane protein TolC